MASPLVPTYKGHIASTTDALILIEACLLGELNHLPRLPHDHERQDLIKSGNVFIYEEHASGIKGWTDGVSWSSSHISGDFLIYQVHSYPSKNDRLVKKTISVAYQGILHHLVSYYNVNDATSGGLSSPSENPQLQPFLPRTELIIPCAELPRHQKNPGMCTVCMYVCMYIFRPRAARPVRSPIGTQDLLS
jgi:hypothetical protein